MGGTVGQIASIALPVVASAFLGPEMAPMFAGLGDAAGAAGAAAGGALGGAAGGALNGGGLRGALEGAGLGGAGGFIGGGGLGNLGVPSMSDMGTSLGNGLSDLFGSVTGSAGGSAPGLMSGAGTDISGGLGSMGGNPLNFGSDTGSYNFASADPNAPAGLSSSLPADPGVSTAASAPVDASGISNNAGTGLNGALSNALIGSSLTPAADPTASIGAPSAMLNASPASPVTSAAATAGTSGGGTLTGYLPVGGAPMGGGGTAGGFVSGAGSSPTSAIAGNSGTFNLAGADTAPTLQSSLPSDIGSNLASPATQGGSNMMNGMLLNNALQGGLAYSMMNPARGGYQAVQAAGQQGAANFAPTMRTGQQASTQIANLNGLNGAPAMQQAQQQWQNTPGYQFALNQGIQGIDASAAARGMLMSGNNQRAVQNYGTGLANQYYQQYLGNLNNQVYPGVMAANGMANNNMSGAQAFAQGRVNQAQPYNQMMGNFASYMAPQIGGGLGGFFSGLTS